MPFNLRIKYKLTPPLLKLSLLLRWPTLTALVLAFSIFRLGPKAKYRVLVLRRSVFMDDIMAMARYGGRIHYLVLNRGFLKQILYYFLNPGEERIVIETDYHKLDIGREGKQKYYEYLKKVFPVLRRLLKFDAVFAGNIGYVEHQELYKICREEGTPFIVLHKEGMAVKIRYAEYAGMYRNHHFLGSKLLFYNHQVRDALLDVGVRGVEKERTAVVGIPRLDHYFSQSFENRPKKILFLSFRPLEKFRYLEAKKDLFAKAEERTQEFHRLVYEFAKARPDFEIIVKTKRSEHYLDYVRSLFSEQELRLPNIHITNIGDPARLIGEAAAVLGFNSTALIEALLAGRPIITPHYGDIIIDGRDWDYFADHKSLVNYARSLEDLERYLIHGEYAKFAPELKQDFLKKLIVVTDGTASQRAEGEIVKTIEEHSHANR